MTTKANIIIIEDEKNICRKGRLTVHHFRASGCDPVRFRSAGYGRLKAH